MTPSSQSLESPGIPGRFSVDALFLKKREADQHPHSGVLLLSNRQRPHRTLGRQVGDDAIEVFRLGVPAVEDAAVHAELNHVEAVVQKEAPELRVGTALGARHNGQVEEYEHAHEPPRMLGHDLATIDRMLTQTD
jgi:hypothetical protein